MGRPLMNGEGLHSDSSTRRKNEARFCDGDIKFDSSSVHRSISP